MTCLSRMIIGKEKEDIAAAMVTGGKVEDMGPLKEASKTLPGCTTEDTVYVIDCQAYRKREIAPQYVDEYSQLGFQRGQVT